MTIAMRTTRRLAGILLAGSALVATAAPSALADPPGCLPLNGALQNANSFTNTNYFGITYQVNVDYWYADGAVNWHKTVDGGTFNHVHNDTTGAVPAAPGAQVAIPGATAGTGADDGSERVGDVPLLVTVCGK